MKRIITARWLTFTGAFGLLLGTVPGHAQLATFDGAQAANAATQIRHEVNVARQRYKTDREWLSGQPYSEPATRSGHTNRRHCIEDIQSVGDDLQHHLQQPEPLQFETDLEDRRASPIGLVRSEYLRRDQRPPGAAEWAVSERKRGVEDHEPCD